MTALHETSHIKHGHTGADQLDDYRTHRGIKEFEAEATAYLVGHELEIISEKEASESRAYCQSWLDGQRPPDASIRRVFGATDSILRAGRLQL
jgi:antirestriction protein ArdC